MTEDTSKFILDEGRIVGISLYGGQVIEDKPQEIVTNHTDLQEVNHEYERRIYTVRECICGRDELDTIHRTSQPDPSADDQHRFERGARAANCKCGEPFWSPVHDVVQFEEERNDG